MVQIINKTIDLPRLLTVREAADFLGVSKSALAQYRQEKTGPTYIKWGAHARIRYADKDLRERLEASRVKSAEAQSKKEKAQSKEEPPTDELMLEGI